MGVFGGGQDRWIWIIIIVVLIISCCDIDLFGSNNCCDPCCDPCHDDKCC